MKKLILIFLILFTADLFSQSGGAVDFLPLKIGNTWVYK
jgi:hypothetical protein